MLSTVNSSKCNYYYVIFFFQNLISQISCQIYSLTDNCYQQRFSLFILLLSIKTAANTIFVLSKISLSSPVVGNSISIYLFQSTLFNTTLCASTLSTQLSNQKLFITPKKGISTLDVPLLGNAVPLHRQVTSGHCSTRLLPKNYLTVHKRVIRPKYSCEYRAPDRPSFLCLASTSP